MQLTLNVQVVRQVFFQKISNMTCGAPGFTINLVVMYLDTQWLCVVTRGYSMRFHRQSWTKYLVIHANTPTPLFQCCDMYFVRSKA